MPNGRPAIAPAPASWGVRLFDLPTALLPVTLPGESCLDTLFFSWLQIERMPLDLFDDVFLLHFSFEASKGIFKCFALLKSYFRQINTPPNRSVILLSPITIL